MAANKTATQAKAPATQAPAVTGLAAVAAQVANAVTVNAAAPVAGNPAPLYPKRHPTQSTFVPPAGSFTYASKQYGNIGASTVLTRTAKPARSGASANTQSAWQAINAMAPGATATAAALMGSNPNMPYGAHGQAAHVKYAIANGYLVVAKA